jgi:uncharacterized protein YjiS (DUF1127 family)
MRITGGSRRDTNDNFSEEDRIAGRASARYARAWAIGDLVADAIIAIVRPFRDAALRVHTWHVAQVHRHALESLSDRELSDIGISRCDIAGISAGTFQRGGWHGEATTPRKPDLRKPRAANDGGRAKPALRRGGRP